MINKKPTLKEKLNEFLLYTDPQGEIKVRVLFHNENIWLSQKQIALLFNVERSVTSKHLKNIFYEKELVKESVCAKFAHTADDGKKYKVNFYNLDAIIAVGYRVNSAKATQFRIWATKTLRNFILKGFILDDRRLKNGQHFGKDYFQELLERVRSIRASERRMYLQITDIFQECSIDYDPKSQTTKNFFATVQNKFHFGIHGKTAAEIIYTKADKNKPNMGLTTWKNSPKGRILQSDTTTAKNYLTKKEIKKLERTISGFFDYVENIIENNNTFTMNEFIKSVDKFLTFNQFKVLEGRGSISHSKAKQKATTEYTKFNKTQKINSDFEKLLEIQSKD